MNRRTAKRVLDLLVAVPGTVVSAPIVLALVAVATVDCRRFGIFTQQRVGRNGAPVHVRKIRTMRPGHPTATTVTVRDDARITRSGRWMRRWKLDELPQLWSVVAGRMSLVGPRPDVSGYADRLAGGDRVVLDLLPGVTGPATLVFRDEEALLADVDDPITYNDRVIWPAKVAINRAYANHATLADDLPLLIMTLRRDDRRLARLLQRWDPSLPGHPAVATALGLGDPAMGVSA